MAAFLIAAVCAFSAEKPEKAEKLGQHQSQWILMKDAALDKDPQSIIFKVFIAVG